MIPELRQLSREDQIILLQRSIEQEQTRLRCEASLAEMFKLVWSILEPGRKLVWGWHIDLMCKFLEDFSKRVFRYGIINIPPRGTKSLLVGVAYPLWVWVQQGVDARYGGPGHQFLTLAHSQGLATRDGVKARIVMEDAKFQALWGDRVKIRPGQNEKANYELTMNGHRNSFGLTSQFMGRGGDSVLIDDANDPETVFSDLERQNTNDSFSNKVPSRLNDSLLGGIMVVMQRLHGLDLTGYLIQNGGLFHPTENPFGWMRLVLPMEFELDEEGEVPVNPAGQWGYADPRKEPGELLMPDRYPRDVVESRIKTVFGGRNTLSHSGQYQQRPAPAEGGIIKKHMWHRWPSHEPLPHCDHIFLSWDTAFTEKESRTAAFSAMTAWGVFHHPHMETQALLCLGAWWGMVAFPELKRLVRAKEAFFEADAHLIEKAASGHSLMQELKRTTTPKGRRILIRGMRPRQMGDKEARVHVASSTFQGGLIFVPSPAHAESAQVDGGDLKWVKGLIDNVAAFPTGPPPCKDIADTVSQAVIYFQRGLWISHPDDLEGDNYVGAASAEGERRDVLMDDDDEELQYGIYG